MADKKFRPLSISQWVLENGCEREGDFDVRNSV
jgi:hypothetical protein